MSYTRGPWKAVQREYGYADFDDGAEVKLFDVYSGDFVVSMGTIYNNEANARLIAAAPDLLSVLKEALNESGCDGDLCCHWWHEAARAAIRKAEGGAE